eukprot:308918-Amphidinium_carterae.1
MLSDACDSNLPFAAWLKNEINALVSATSVLEQRSVIYYPVRCVCFDDTHFSGYEPNSKQEQSVAISDFRAEKKTKTVSTPPGLRGVPTYPMTPVAHPESHSPVPPLNFSQCAGAGPQRQAPGRSPDDHDSFSLSGHNFPKKTPVPRQRRPGRGSPGPGHDDDDGDDGDGSLPSNLAIQQGEMMQM